MADRVTSSIPLSTLPDCVLMPDQRTHLKDWLIKLNQQVGALKGGSDDTFTKDDFESAKSFSWGANLKRFGSFGDFAAYLDKYTLSKLCNSECEKEASPLSDGNGLLRVCPESPELPPLPESKPKAKTPRANTTPPERKYVSNPLGIDPERTPWASEDSNLLPELPRKPDVAASLSPPLHGKKASPFEKYIDDSEDVPEGEKVAQGEMKASFDGKNFIFEIRGCIIFTQTSTNCDADWPWFLSYLHNTTSGKMSHKKANKVGWARMKVAAKPGDILVFHGVDSKSQRLSVNEGIFEITKDGKVRFVGNFPNRLKGPLQQLIENLSDSSALSQTMGDSFGNDFNDYLNQNLFHNR